MYQNQKQLSKIINEQQMLSSPNQALLFTPQSSNKQSKLQNSNISPVNFNQHSVVKQFLSHDHDYLAYITQVLACIIWTTSYIYTNQQNFNSFQNLMVKGVVGTILNYLVLRFRGFGVNFQSPRIFKGLLLINISVLSYLFMLPIAQLYLPLPIVHTIGCSSIAFVYIFDYFVNGSKMTNAGLLGILSAIIGVVLMTNSRLLMSLIDKDYVFDSKFGNYIASTILFSSFVASMLFAARVFNSYGLVKLKHYPQISVFELNYFNNILCTFTGGIGYMFRTDNKGMEIFWPSILSIGVGQFVCFTLFFYSLKLTKKTGNVMLINGSNIIIAFAISYFRYGQRINIVLILGALSIFAGMTIIIVETYNSKKKNNIINTTQQKNQDVN